MRNEAQGVHVPLLSAQLARLQSGADRQGRELLASASAAELEADNCLALDTDQQGGVLVACTSVASRATILFEVDAGSGTS